MNAYILRITVLITMRKGIVGAGAIILLIVVLLIVSSATVGLGWLESNESEKEVEGQPENIEIETPVWYRIAFVITFTLAMGFAFLFLHVRDRRIK